MKTRNRKVRKSRNRNRKTKSRIRSRIIGGAAFDASSSQSLTRRPFENKFDNKFPIEIIPELAKIILVYLTEKSVIHKDDPQNKLGTIQKSLAPCVRPQLERFYNIVKKDDDDTKGLNELKKLANIDPPTVKLNSAFKNNDG